eukprot:gene335-259_t
MQFHFHAVCYWLRYRILEVLKNHTVICTFAQDENARFRKRCFYISQGRSPHVIHDDRREDHVLRMGVVHHGNVWVRTEHSTPKKRNAQSGREAVINVVHHGNFEQQMGLGSMARLLIGAAFPHFDQARKEFA